MPVLNTLYLRIARDHLYVKNVENGREAELHANPPFSNARLLIADFSQAERLIKQLMKEVLTKRFMLVIAPKMVIHPLECLEGGLSMVEERALWEVGKSSGARQVVVHVGERLDAAGVRACLKKPCA